MNSEVWAAAEETVTGNVPWVGYLIAFLTILGGGGGVVAWLRLRHDRRIGIQQQEVSEDDALSDRWKALIQAQTQTLLEPMTARIVKLETAVTTLEGELAESRRKYWSLISYVRTLMTWIARHMPEEIEHTQVPQPPAMLAEDI